VYEKIAWMIAIGFCGPHTFEDLNPKQEVPKTLDDYIQAS